MTLSLAIEICGFLLGLLYLWYEYHANSRMWLVGLVMPLMSMYVYYTKGLYADFGMNIYYFLMAIYGYAVWTFNFKHKIKTSRPITHINRKKLIGTIVVFVAVYALLAAWLVCLTDSTVPYYDAFTTAMSIIGTWMLARKYIEQWFVWIVVDAVCVALYIYKGIYFYAALYAAYTTVAIFGYSKWRKLMA